jgi:Flp pilus assembly pilin Flp
VDAFHPQPAAASERKVSQMTSRPEFVLPSLFTCSDSGGSERGAAFTEYVILVAFVVAAFAGLISTFGATLLAKLQAVIASL